METLNNSWNLLIQIPLAGLVVFLTIRFLAFMSNESKENRALISKMNTDNQIAETERQRAVLEFIAKQEETNRAFLATQRDQMNQSISRLAEEIKTNKVDTLKELASIVGLVDKVIDKINVVTDKLRDIALVVNTSKPTSGGNQ